MLHQISTNRKNSYKDEKTVVTCVERTEKTSQHLCTKQHQTTYVDETR